AGRDRPAAEFIGIGRPYPPGRMRAARAISRADMRSFHMEAGNSSAAREFLLRAVQIREAGEHVRRRAGNHRGKETCDAGSEDGVDGAGDFEQRGEGRIEVDAGEAVDLKVDETGRQKLIARRLLRAGYLLNCIAEANCEISFG